MEITEIIVIALTLGAGSLLQSAVGFGFGLFVDRDSLCGSGNIHFAAVDRFRKIVLSISLLKTWSFGSVEDPVSGGQRQSALPVTVSSRDGV